MVNVCYYDKDAFDCQQYDRLTDIHWPTESKLWIDFSDEPSEDEIHWLSEQLGLHPIAIKSLFDASRHSRLQEFTQQIYLGTWVLTDEDPFSANEGASAPDDQSELQVKHLGLVLGGQFLISAHSGPLATIERSRKRLQDDAGEVRSQAPDFLLYQIMDGVVDDYYEAVDRMSEQIDDLDTRMDEPYDRRLQHDVLVSKRRLLVLHKAITPLRDTLLNLRRLDHPIISHHTDIYMRDIFEHILQLLDTIDTYRDVLSNTVELGMAAASNRMNEVMTVLTVVTSFFIPLSFITGYFGMNLAMPEMNNPITYPIVIGLMLATVISMIIWFKRKKWL
ncbi:MAG: magnesium/cobalt transporter CorA [Clostridiaceae bacterium]|nr:magnesium/cobalt transporter CorA [Clostridiaceae bacterium]